MRVTDAFMHAVVDDADWDLKAVIDGETVQTVKARDLMRQIAQSAWECADPGMQFDTTINRWHTASNTGRINASNPCFTATACVHTDKGLIRFDELVDASTRRDVRRLHHDATNPDAPLSASRSPGPSGDDHGWNEIVRLRFGTAWSCAARRATDLHGERAMWRRAI